jgi:beta-lactamase superfamily II metal-dependent hydrolase
LDALLKGDSFQFSIDEIYLVKKKENLFGATLIPNINSTYFPPWLLRSFIFHAKFLSKEFYDSYKSKVPDLQESSNINFQSIINQGDYFDVPTKYFPNNKIPNSPLDDDFQEVLNQHREESPFNDILEAQEKTIDIQSGLNLLNSEETSGEENSEVLLYCFNVGQGDSNLLIFPNGHVYIIDTNIYTDEKHFNNLKKYISNIKKILKIRKLPPEKIKGLIITHKHADHLRGAQKLIESKQFCFENFLMNYDYRHPTKIVRELILSAEKNIAKNININREGYFLEGEVLIDIFNPGNATKNEKVCKDINDSSISLFIKHGKSSAILTGDIGYPVLNSKLFCPLLFQGDTILKISHHGSRTGTDSIMLKNLTPKFAFISAGDHKKFKHPHNDVIKIIKEENVDYDVSKEAKCIIRYRISSKEIKKQHIFI